MDLEGLLQKIVENNKENGQSQYTLTQYNTEQIALNQQIKQKEYNFEENYTQLQQIESSKKTPAKQDITKTIQSIFDCIINKALFKNDSYQLISSICDKNKSLYLVFVSLILKQYKYDLDESTIIKLLAILLDNLTKQDIKWSNFSDQLIPEIKQEQELLAQDGQVLSQILEDNQKYNMEILVILLQLLTLPITKEKLVKELKLRQLSIVQLELLLQVFTVILSFTVKESKLPQVSQISEWLSNLIDAYYLQFVLNESLKKLLAALYEILIQYQELDDQIKKFQSEENTFDYLENLKKEKYGENLSQFYTKFVYL
eukprot:TRINITY_DN7668_c0_g2_i12.p1 TRINITY_DN7668_c0_g2~~TRINITY_DN7668_c0_g2_i12.p1  ORF type:complete len:315 (-),score=63.73 TRINITY_DN7668_c0_g2_i12:840-1784(-)